MYDGIFKPCGNTILISASSDASAGQQVSTGSVPNARLFAPAGNVWVAIGTSSVAAAVPTTAVPSNGVLLPTAVPTVLDIGPNAYLSAITTAGASGLVYITPGLGGRV